MTKEKGTLYSVPFSDWKLSEWKLMCKIQIENYQNGKNACLFACTQALQRVVLHEIQKDESSHKNSHNNVILSCS